MRKGFGRIGAAVFAALAALPAGAARAADGGELSQALDRIKRTHVVRVGYRESSPPFSFLDRAGRPVGYSIGICEAIVDEIGQRVDEPALSISYIKVTSGSRIDAVVNGDVDLECGSTTANVERAARVAFSPVIYIAGTKLMVSRTSQVQSVQDLAHKSIVVTRGTTNEQAVRALDRKETLGLTILTADDHEQSYQMLEQGKADAFATDDILLYGLIATHKAEARFQVVGDFLSYDPYGIMFRKGDPQLAAVVEHAMRKLATNQDLLPLYRKWFLGRLPTGEKLGVQLSPQLEDAFRVLDDSPAGAR
ncbi:MAG: amino acid ABC transporter substrate-binding protein [Xanthobacteraceae bacterium]|nr:amino acid ABC transporter substrate-binding protein [Xanthobacteraceae bacterium]